MEAIKAVAPHLQSDPKVDKKIIGSLWAICELARSWGIRPNGILRRNNLISTEDVARLERWVLTISWTVSTLLDGANFDDAVAFAQEMTEDE